MRSFFTDLRYALRQLRQAPAFALTAVLTLALGVGAAAAVLAVARQVLLAPLPYPQPAQLVGIAFDWPGEGVNAGTTGEAGQFLMEHDRSFSAAVLLNNSATQTAYSDGHGGLANLGIQSVSRGWFGVVGVAPMLGRAFSADEDRPGGPQAVVLSYGLWRRAFHGGLGILGRAIRLDRQPVTVVGVMPASFRAEAYATENSLGAPDAWRPLQGGPNDPGWLGHNYQLWGRLRPGISLAQARSEGAALDAALYRAYPRYKTYTNEGLLPHVAIFPLQAVLASEARPSLLVLTSAVGSVLLLAAVNLSGLTLARTLRRALELALRAALGASRARLVRFALAEPCLLTFAGAAGAVLTARVLLPLLLRTSPIPIPQLSGSASGWALAGLSGALALGSALLFAAPGIYFALRQSRPESFGAARTTGRTRAQARFGRGLIGAQMALAVLLLSAASLLLGTFLKLRAQPLGFRPERLAVFQTSLRGNRYSAAAATQRFVEQVLTQLRQAPGVRTAAASNGLALDGGLNETGWPDGRAGTVELTEFRAVTPGFFQTMGIPLLAGRDLLPSDAAESLTVTVISAATAAHWWPHRSALGAVVHTGEKSAYRIVGIAADVPNRNPADKPKVLLYAPLAQLDDGSTKTLNGWFPISFTIRLGADIDLAKLAGHAVSSVDPDVPVTGLETMQTLVDHSIAAPRFFTDLAEAFAGFALLLTAIGLWGLLSSEVIARTREIGIRMALGATRERILGSVLLGSSFLTLGGTAAGLAAAVLTKPLLTRWIVQNVLQVSDAAGTALLLSGPAVLAIAAAGLVAVALAASAGPARRAAQTDPMVTLRAE